VIEGVRLLPWLQQASRSNPAPVAHLLDCEACMRERPAAARARIRCGYVEPASDGSAWWPRGFRGFGSPPVGATTCPGYTTSLPEVVEISRLHLHWSKGALRDRVRRPTGHVLDMIEVLACEQSAVEWHEIKTAKEK